MRRVLVTLLILFGGVGAGSVYAQDKTQSIVRWGNDVTVEAGKTVESAVAIGGNVTINGTVTKDAVAIGGTVRVNPGATVGKNAVSIGGAVIASTAAVVRGDFVEVNPPGMSGMHSGMHALQRTNWWHVWWTIKLFTFIGFLALAILLVAVAPRYVATVSSIIEEDFWYSLLAGVIGMLLIVPLAILLIVTVVGIVLIPLEFIAVVLAFAAGYILVSRVVGKRVFEVFHAAGKPVVLETLVGIVILTLAGSIPFVGWLVRAVVWTTGFGGIILAIIRSRKTPPQEKGQIVT